MDTDEIRRIAVDTLIKAKRAEDLIGTVTDDTFLGPGGLSVNSLALLQAFVMIENRFGFVFDDALVANAKLSTVGEFVTLVQQALDSRSV
jgi:acyl carrier protein